MRRVSNRICAALAAIAAAVATLVCASPALARYTAIDQVAILDADGNQTYDDFGNLAYSHTSILFEGYCDSREIVGDQCDETYTLPYTAIFNGLETNQVLLRDDGNLDFVFGAPNDLSDSPSDYELTHRFAVLATFNSGIDNYRQFATFQLQGSSFLANWFTCPSPGPSCRTNQHTALFTPGARGFDIAFTDLSGAVHDEFLKADFNPSQGTAVPEPTTWTIMVVGFGGAGLWLRHRRRRSFATQACQSLRMAQSRP